MSDRFAARIVSTSITTGERVRVTTAREFRARAAVRRTRSSCAITPIAFDNRVRKKKKNSTTDAKPLFESAFNLPSSDAASRAVGTPAERRTVAVRCPKPPVAVSYGIDVTGLMFVQYAAQSSTPVLDFERVSVCNVRAYHLYVRNETRNTRTPREKYQHPVYRETSLNGHL